MQAIALWTFADPAALSHGIIWWIIVGLIAGWAAGKIMKGRGYGPIVDIALGIAGAQLVGVLERLPFIVDLPAVLIALGVSVLVGLVFGLLPAWRAAHVDPATALRQ